MQADFKPCPFCGHEEVIIDPRDNDTWCKARCLNCRSESGGYPSIAEATAAWNWRDDAATVKEQPVESLLANLVSLNLLLNAGDYAALSDQIQRCISSATKRESGVFIDEHTVAPAKSDWQPIETAPKDGRLLLLYGNGQLIFGSWTKFLNSEVHEWIDSEYIESHDPTHWMLMPSLPANEIEGGNT